MVSAARAAPERVPAIQPHQQKFATSPTSNSWTARGVPDMTWSIKSIPSRMQIHILGPVCTVHTRKGSHTRHPPPPNGMSLHALQNLPTPVLDATGCAAASHALAGGRGQRLAHPPPCPARSPVGGAVRRSGTRLAPPPPLPDPVRGRHLRRAPPTSDGTAAAAATRLGPPVASHSAPAVRARRTAQYLLPRCFPLAVARRCHPPRPSRPAFLLSPRPPSPPCASRRR